MSLLFLFSYKVIHYTIGFIAYSKKRHTQKNPQTHGLYARSDT